MDFLFGNAGNDTLTGGAGNDTFAFDTALSAGANLDTLTDFAAGADRIYLSNAAGKPFAALAGGSLAASAFSTGSVSADTRLIYSATTGELSYDADGSGSAYAAVKFAVLGTASHPLLSASDFLVGA